MKEIILFDGEGAAHLLPLTYTRAVADMRVGMTTIREKWRYITQAQNWLLSPQQIQSLHALIPDKKEEYWYIYGGALPNVELWRSIQSLSFGTSLWKEDMLIGFKLTERIAHEQIEEIVAGMKNAKINAEADVIIYPEDILSVQENYVKSDFKRLTQSRQTNKVDLSSYVRGTELFVDDNCKVHNAVLNTEDGPIYVDRDCHIMEGAVIHGPAYIGRGSLIQIGAKIYGNTVIGPYCRVGGEVKRSCIMGYTNKAHEGFLGDSLIGEWCNFGADTNCSNMKNTRGNVTWYDIDKQVYRKTNKQFLGLLMGDFSVCAINTAFNTGTVVGIGCNIYGGDPERYQPSFSWGINGERYQLEKIIEVIKLTMSRREVKMTDEFESLLRHIHAAY